MENSFKSLAYRILRQYFANEQQPKRKICYAYRSGNGRMASTRGDDERMPQSIHK